MHRGLENRGVVEVGNALRGPGVQALATTDPCPPKSTWIGIPPGLGAPNLPGSVPILHNSFHEGIVPNIRLNLPWHSPRPFPHPISFFPGADPNSHLASTSHGALGREKVPPEPPLLQAEPLSQLPQPLLLLQPLPSSVPFPGHAPAPPGLSCREGPRRAPIHPCSGVSSPLDSPNIPHPWLGTKLPRFPQRCQEKTASPIPSSPPFPPPALPKSRNGWGGDLQSHPIPTPTSSTGPGCSKPHPWTLPGIQGQLQLLWECCAREGHAPWTNPGGPSGSSGGSRSVGAAPVPFPAGCTCAGPVAVARSWCFQLEFHALGSIPGSGVGSGIYSQALESIPRVQSLSTGSGVPFEDLGSIPQDLGSLPRVWGPFPGSGVHPYIPSAPGAVHSLGRGSQGQ
ncbi:WAS/WASL-interacting protein family member 3-like isoform X1 [Corvus kubaryi]|uniref:WAS/WASL-interacting protein family member 3-like isoform X1 n=1 Tax=Corvus kubaryi TaxID=68294 RepID=UPI001C0591F6|nr:WAS/WASL-interacting protein family member 3-like isoform X1 [Corvus kubaryi]